MLWQEKMVERERWEMDAEAFERNRFESTPWTAQEKKIKARGDFAKNGQKIQIVEMGERRSCRWDGLTCNTQNTFCWIV